MKKRKADCSIDEFIVEYLKKKKFAKTLKLFEKNDPCNVYESFMNYLRNIETEKVTMKDELGFEINFEAYQHEVKVSHFKTHIILPGPYNNLCYELRLMIYINIKQ